MRSEDRAGARSGPSPAGRLRAPLAAISLFLAAGPAARAAGPPANERAGPVFERPACRYAGRPLAEALGELRALGLNLVFSSDLVRPDMIVVIEPPVAGPRQMLDRLLASFGLEALDGPGGTILVVRAAVRDPVDSDGAGPSVSGQDGRPILARPALREKVEVGASTRGEPARVTTLTRDEIERSTAPGDDAARSIAFLPGIVSADKSAQFGIRGGGSDETILILDGLEIDEPYHLKDFLAFSSMVDSRAIGRMDVLTGIFPAEYGDRMSGVVDMTTADPAGEPNVAGASLINAGVFSGGHLGEGGSWLVSARSWFPDAVLDIVDPGGEDISPSYNDLLGKVQFRLPGGSLLSAHLLASTDALDYRADLGDAGVRAGDDHRHAWINWKAPLTPRLYAHTLVSSGSIARSRHGGTLDDSGAVTRVDDERAQESARVKQDWVFSTSPDSSWKWGFEVLRHEAEYVYRGHVARTDPLGAGGSSVVLDRDLALEPSGSEFGAYVASRFRLAAPLSVEIGLRRDRQTLTGEAETSPRVNLAWALGERSVVRAGWGRFHQPQGIHELQIEDGVLRFFPAERAERREIDFDHRFAGGLTLGVSVYTKEMTHLRPRYENLFNPLELFPETEPDRVRVDPDRASARGVEIGLGVDRGRSLIWRASYAIASARDRVDGAWVPRSFDQRHTLNLGLGYRRGDRWDLSLAGVYHSGWPATGMRAVQVTNPDGSIAVQAIAGPRNASRYPPYHRLDLSVTRHFKAGGGTIDVYLDVTNLYDRRNVCCARDFEFLPQADGGVRVRRIEKYWLRDLPIVGLTWRF